MTVNNMISFISLTLWRWKDVTVSNMISLFDVHFAVWWLCFTHSVRQVFRLTTLSDVLCRVHTQCWKSGVFRWALSRLGKGVGNLTFPNRSDKDKLWRFLKFFTQWGSYHSNTCGNMVPLPVLFLTREQKNEDLYIFSMTVGVCSVVCAKIFNWSSFHFNDCGCDHLLSLWYGYGICA